VTSKEIYKNRYSLAWLRNAGSYDKVSYCTVLVQRRRRRRSLFVFSGYYRGTTTDTDVMKA